jgi:tetratricopeptide (TPR) repeat protein
MRTAILRSAGSLVLLVFYGWAIFARPTDAGASPEDLQALAEYSRTSFEAGRYADALPPTLTLHDARPANLLYLKRLAGIYGKLERAGDEAAAWERFLASSPTPQEACPHLGDAYFRMGLIERSVDASARCQAFDPTDPDANYYLARAHLRGGRLREAREGAGTLVAERPDHVDALLILGLAFQREGNLAEARKALERGVQLEPGYVGFDTALGLIAEVEGRFGEAKAHYIRALALDPKDPDAPARLHRLSMTPPKTP